MKTRSMGEEIRRRFPRLAMSLLMAIIFWIINIVVPPTVSGIIIPGLNVNADTLVWIITMLFTATFLIRALPDVLVLSDIVTDIVVKRLGVKEEESSRRAARDAIYIIVIILVETALYPLLNMLGDVGSTLTTITTYAALAIILLLIYDIGRILYRMIERRAESMADRLVRMAERGKEG